MVAFRYGHHRAEWEQHLETWSNLKVNLDKRGVFLVPHFFLLPCLLLYLRVGVYQAPRAIFGYTHPLSFLEFGGSPVTVRNFKLHLSICLFELCCRSYCFRGEILKVAIGTLTLLRLFVRSCGRTFFWTMKNVSSRPIEEAFLKALYKWESEPNGAFGWGGVVGTCKGKEVKMRCAYD